MSWLRTIARELAGLFIDDGLLALAIVAWVGVCAGLMPRLGLPSAYLAPIWFAGLVVILIESVTRSARRK